MGFKRVDLIPINLTTFTPSSKSVKVLGFQIFRTDTAVGGVLKAVLPGGASITDVKIVNSTASNAGTSATVNVGIPGTVNAIVNAQSVLAAAGQLIRPAFGRAALVEGDPPILDQNIVANYAETGTASTAGGPWTVLIEYVD
ncbi:hypothetical protein [Microcystis sp. M42BS1]|uniref:hypothetical protein n=1 Tax=Microcystis sp. M42BS1 TaxID=2771192 RepID=UPI00258CB481|nr:hypothetical protein [Microcystis sp. M42BS1]MCA2570697.1 hypothetical protein [Microcystis sp. M42BS1]